MIALEQLGVSLLSGSFRHYSNLRLNARKRNWFGKQTRDVLLDKPKTRQFYAFPLRANATRCFSLQPVFNLIVSCAWHGFPHWSFFLRRVLENHALLMCHQRNLISSFTRNSSDFPCRFLQRLGRIKAELLFIFRAPYLTTDLIHHECITF